MLNKHTGRHYSAFKDLTVEKAHREKAKANTVWQISTYPCFIFITQLIMLCFLGVFTKGISDYEKIMKDCCFLLCK